MKLSISRNDLLEPLQKVIGVIEKRQTMQTLSHVLLEVNNDTFLLTGTDLELTLVTTTAHPSTETGKATLPARKLYDICKALPEDAAININIEDQKATLQSGRSRFTLGCLSADDYPKLEDIEATNVISVPQSKLLTIINRTSFAMAKQDVRYYLNGILLEVGDTYLRSVATDGHRLSLCDTDVDLSGQEKTQVIIPRKAVIEMLRLLDPADDTPIELSLSNNHIRLRSDGLEMTSKLIDGRFPEYERVLPEGNDQLMKGERATLKQTLFRASILSNEKYRGIRLILSENILKIQSHNSEQEEAKDEVEVDYSGPEIEIGFNVQYLLDILNAIEGDTVDILFKDANSSILITDSEYQAARYVAMPMRL